MITEVRSKRQPIKVLLIEDDPGDAEFIKETLPQKTTEVPILILTGRNDDELAEQVVQEVAQDYRNICDITPKLLYQTIQYSAHRNRVNFENSQKEKLQGAPELAGTASHNISQPLPIIAGFVHLMNAKYSTDFYLHEKLRIIEEQLQKVNTITYQLQNLTRYQTEFYLHDSVILNLGESTKE